MTERNRSLDLLRGLAILMVVVVHCQEEAGIAPGLLWVREIGLLGVPLFFIVSGYTMMLTFGDRIDLGATWSFYLRRFFRIAPLFWIAIVFYLAITRGEGIRNFAPDGVSARDVLLTFGFLHWASVTAYNSVVPGGWSIAVEMQFYLLFPVVIWLFRRRGGATFCYALIALLSVAGQFAADHYVTPWLAASLPAGRAYLAEGIPTAWLPHQAIWFGFGILLYDLIERRSRPVLGALLLLGASLFSAWGIEAALLAVFAWAALAGNVSIPWLALFGRHSYAIYLIHFAVLSSIAGLVQIGLVPLFASVSAASLAFSYYLIEPLIERRFNRLGHRLASSAARPQAVATTA